MPMLGTNVKKRTKNDKNDILSKNSLPYIPHIRPILCW